jgi:hypothetical protein
MGARELDSNNAFIRAVEPSECAAMRFERAVSGNRCVPGVGGFGVVLAAV